jgi:hypothetical protein
MSSFYTLFSNQIQIEQLSPYVEKGIPGFYLHRFATCNLLSLLFPKVFVQFHSCNFRTMLTTLLLLHRDLLTTQG